MWVGHFKRCPSVKLQIHSLNKFGGTRESGKKRLMYKQRETEMKVEGENAEVKGFL